MHWIRETLASAKSGDRKALLKLAIPVALFCFVAFTLFGQQAPATSVQVPINPTPVSRTVSTEIWVHITGEVQAPGVYSLPLGSRLFQLVAAAGGFTRKANQSSVNLARQVVDGEQITVGNSQTAGVIAGADSTININAATSATIETLPGVGPTLAGRIVDWREANHGFKAVSDLRKVAGIGDKLFAQIKNLVTL